MCARRHHFFKRQFTVDIALEDCFRIRSRIETLNRERSKRIAHGRRATFALIESQSLVARGLFFGRAVSRHP